MEWIEDVDTPTAAKAEIPQGSYFVLSKKGRGV